MPESLPLSLLNDYLYCPRRAALKVVEGWRSANQHTHRGDLVHEHADLPGYDILQGVTLLRALPVFSETLGLSGKCDIVERHPDRTLVPVEFKLGKRRQWQNDDVQLCAQALCLEEMFGLAVPAGAVFHAQSQQRQAAQGEQHRIEAGGSGRDQPGHAREERGGNPGEGSREAEEKDDDRWPEVDSQLHLKERIVEASDWSSSVRGS